MNTKTNGKSRSANVRHLMLLLILAAAASFAYIKFHSAAKDTQGMQAKGFNPDALKGWEVAKSDPNIGDAKTGLSPENKKKMREQFALECRGDLASTKGVSVELEGETHDRLIFSVNCAIATNGGELFIDALRQYDPNFGNRLRLLDFSEMVLAGTNYSETFSQTDFSKWSQGYDAFVSNNVAIYTTAGNQNSFFNKKDEISPEIQKILRSKLAEEMGGALKSIYKSFEVKLVGANDDVLDFSCKDASEQDMNEILNQLREDKTGNFFNGLTAAGVSELVLEGGDYRRSIPRSEFTQWCRNYDAYMTEMQKLVGQMSGALKHDYQAP